MKALLIHHDVGSRPGIVADALAARGVELVSHQVCDDPVLPDAARPFPTLDADLGADLVVLLGSKWSVYDPAIAPWLTDELDLVRRADDAGIPVLGICFGGQVLAAAHGAGVEPAPDAEIGWYAVESNHPHIGTGPWFQWHGDRFAVPAGADHLAHSTVGPQAFTLRRNLGLQFHPEVDRAVLDGWMVTDRHELTEAGIDPDALLDDTDRHEAEVRPRTVALVDWFLDDVARR